LREIGSREKIGPGLVHQKI